MTHREILTLPDGTRRYADGHRYTPLTPEQRKYGVNKPEDPRAVRFHGQWFTPLQLLPLTRREMPETRPDSETLLHSARCRCRVCRRPAAARLWRIQRRRRPS